MIDEIHLSLEEILSIKQDLREVANIPNTIPFSAYYSYMAWQEDLDNIPLSPKYLDFTKNRYSESGVPCGINSVGSFTRLTSATMWQDGQLVEVQNNMPRINNDGLLIEPQITNDMSSGDFKNNYIESLTQVTTGVDSGLGFNYTSFVGGGGEQRETVAFGMQGVSYFPVDFKEGRGISFLVKAEAPVRYMRFSLYPAGMPKTHHFNTTIDLSDGSTVREHLNFTVPNVGLMGGGWLRVDFLSTYLLHPAAYRYLNVTFGMDGEDGADPTTWTTLPEGVEVGLALPQHVTPPVYSSLTNSYGTPATRAPDILIIDVEPNQYISGDWDEGVVFEQFSGYAKFSGHGYIRNIEVLDLQGRPA